MKNDHNRSERYDLIMALLIVAIAVFSVVSSLLSLLSVGNPTETVTDSKVFDYSAGWKKNSGYDQSLKDIFAGQKTFSVTEPLVLHRTLSENDMGKILYIHSRNVVINLYANGNPVHITADNGVATSISGFDNYIFTALPTSNWKCELEMHIYSTSYEAQMGIGEILIGSENAILKKLLLENMFPLISGVIFIVLGIGLIIFGISTRKKIESAISGIYFGVFLIFISVGWLFDTSCLHVINENIGFSETSQRIFLLAALPVFLTFIDTFFETEHIYPVKIAALISAIAFPVVLILNSIGIVTFIDITIYYFIFVIICCAVVFEELLVFMAKTRGSKVLRKQRDYISVFIFIGCLMVDIFIFLNMPVSKDDLLFTKIGLFVLSAFMIASWYNEILGIIRLGVQAGKIGKIAFTDANTGIGNVAAFKSEFEELESKKFAYQFIAVVQFDVNNLKKINDSKGHEAGDLLIKSAAEIINKSFGTIGNCYRTGGDEFVALITDDHAPIICEEAIFNFNRLIDKFNAQENKPFDLRIAYGIAYYESSKNSLATLKEVHKLADERMYENKKMLKARYARTPEEAQIR